MRPTFLPFGRPDYTDAEIAAVTRVLRSGWSGMGPETAAFEHELAVYLGVNHVVAVSSCTAALTLTLAAMGISGKDISVPSLTWCSTANAILATGNRPVFVDVDPDTMQAPAAAVFVRYGGYTADTINSRAAFAVVDSAHTLTYKGDAPTCYSFYANKPLSCGEGGAVATNNYSLACAVRKLRNHGFEHTAWSRYTTSKPIVAETIDRMGFKAPFNDIAAAIARVQLRRQPEMHERRVAVANVYREEICRAVPGAAYQEGADSDDARTHSLHLFVVKLPIASMERSRDHVVAAMRARNIGVAIHYTPLHWMGAYAQYAASPLPVTDDLAQRVITLPISASMTADDAWDVVRALREEVR